MDITSFTFFTWTLLFIGALMVGVSKAGFGAGAGILAVPLIALAIGARGMLPVLLPVLICGDIFALLHYAGKNDRDWRNLRLLLPCAIAGITIGMLVLDWFMKISAGKGDRLLETAVGGICVIFAAMQAYNYLLRKFGHKEDKHYKPAWWQGAGMGIAAGITSTLAHSAGPLIALFLLPQRLPRRVFVGTAVFYFFVGNLIKLIPYSTAGLFSKDTLTLSLYLFPAAIAGTIIGSQLNKHLTDFYFNLIVYAVTFATGISLLV
ncbi:MAG: sulfite exporter TauE/SafE family protein [Lentisphaeria bacterium]